jgi:hypothetical protein
MFAAIAILALAQAAPPPPLVNPPNAPVAIPNPDGFSDQQIAAIQRIVDQAVDRVAVNRPGLPIAAPQSPPTNYVSVIEPAGPIRRVWGHLGDSISRAARPRVRRMQVVAAPVTASGQR